MRIPEIRKRLTEVADDLERTAETLEAEAADLRDRAALLRHYEGQMYRRSFPRAPNDSPPLTPALKRRIKAYAAAHPYATQSAMAKRFNVNAGRISETLKGVRK